MPITPFLAAYYVLSVLAVLAAWMKGGPPERLGALATLVVFAVSFWTHELRIGQFFAGDAVADVVFTGFVVWMAMTRDRWWPLIMSGIMALTLLVYLAALIVPGIGPYAVMSARVGLGILTMLTLLAGVLERWLAGEPPVSATQRWRPPTRRLNI